MPILEITVVASLVQVVLALFTDVQQADESQKSWGFLARRSRDILIALSQSRTVAPGFSSQADRLTAFFNTIQEYYTNEVQALHRVERVFRANKIRRRIEQFCRELSVLWQSVKLALNINSNDMLNEADLRQAVQHDEAQNVALIAQIATLLQQNNAAVLDQVDIRLNQQEWKIRQATAALHDLLQDNKIDKQVIDKAVAPLLHMLQSQSRISRSMKHELWRIPAGSITNRSLEPIARGGFGEVYSATYYGSDVAVKQLLTSYPETEIAQFRREIEVWYKLSHPNILPLHGACDTTERPFMVSPFMKNGTLKRYISDRQNPRSLDDRLRLVYEVASGMAYLHGNAIVHGDLKSLNVLLDGEYRAVISDFGMARTKHTSASSTARPGQSVGGTLDYMAPELLDEESPSGSSKKTDVYAFGIMLYEALKNDGSIWTSGDGQPLVQRAIERLVCNGRRPDRFEGIPDQFWSLIEQCWHQDPTKRPAFKEIVSILASFRSATPPQTPIGNLSQQMQSIDISPTPSPRRERSRPTSSQGRSFGSSQSSGTLTLAQRLTNFGLPRAVLIGIQRGDVDAHLTAARMVSDGKPANNPAWTTAAELFQAAADKGDLEAAFQLGWLHFAGIGIAQSDIEAIAYWHLVHSQSSNAIMKSIAMFMTGCCCYLGRGTQLDESRAHQFFCESMTPEFPFGRLLVYGDGKTESFSPVAVGFFQLCQLGSDHDWFCRHLVAKCMLGGFGVKKDREFAVGIMHELAYQGYSISQFALAECYCMGLGVPEDPVKGIKWLTTAANQGNADAQFALGGCYCKGEDVTQDHAKGIEWFTKAANQGNADAEFALGVCYCKGEGVTQDYAKAIKWLTKAARQGNAESQDWLGDCYRDGKGVPKNTETARSWYQKAAAQGNKNAQTSLSKLR